MAQWPTGSVSKVHSDQLSNDPVQWRTELNTLVDKLNTIIAAFAQANGVCDLDAHGNVPAARLALALRVANNLSDLGDKDTALSNLGGTATGKNLFKAGSVAAARTLLQVDQSGIPDATPSTLMKRDASGRAKVAAPAADQDIATKEYVDASGALTGEVRMYGGSTTPPGWLFCLGQAVSRTTYADLFAVIGVAFGVGGGSTTFQVPDLRASVPIGFGTTTAAVTAKISLGDRVPGLVDWEQRASTTPHDGPLLEGDDTRPDRGLFLGLHFIIKT